MTCNGSAPIPTGNNSLFVPSLKEVVVFASAYPSAAIPSFLTSIPIALAPSVGLPTNVFDYLGQDKNNIAPRLGLRVGGRSEHRDSRRLRHLLQPVARVLRRDGSVQQTALRRLADVLQFDRSRRLRSR